MLPSVSCISVSDVFPRGMSQNGFTPLHIASQQGNLDVVKYLVGKGADIKAKNVGGMIPIDLAKTACRSSVVTYFQTLTPVSVRAHRS